jgi:hypothetical protein
VAQSIESSNKVSEVQVLFLFEYLKRVLTGKKFSTNEEVITETEAYFETMLKSCYKNGIEKLYMIALIVASPSNASILNNKIEFYQKKCVI